MYHFPLSNKIRLSIGCNLDSTQRNLFIRLGAKSFKHQCLRGPDRYYTSMKWPRYKEIGDSGQFREHLFPKAEKSNPLLIELPTSQRTIVTKACI